MVDVWAPCLTVTTLQVGTVRVCHAVGEVDLSSAGQLRRALARARIERGGVRPARVVLDLSEVGFLGTDGMRVLAIAADKAHACGYRFDLVVATHPVRRALTVGGLVARLRVYPSLTEALQPPVAVAGAAAEPGR